MPVKARADRGCRLWARLTSPTRSTIWCPSPHTSSIAQLLTNGVWLVVSVLAAVSFGEHAIPLGSWAALAAFDASVRQRWR